MSSSSSAVKSNKMPVEKKITKKAETPVVVAAVVATPAPAGPTPAAKKAGKKAVAAAEVVVPVAAGLPELPASPVTQSADAILTSLTEKLKALSTEFTAKVREAVKATQDAAKQAKREQRDSKKKRKINPEDMTPEQKKAWEARRANNAFLVQRPLSPELCTFMGIAAGSKRSQTEVTKFISTYVKTHNCFDPSFKRRIVPNAALGKLLRVDDKTEVTYLNLQTYLKVHFVKPATA